jgi:hypothetical protein
VHALWTLSVRAWASGHFGIRTAYAVCLAYLVDLVAVEYLTGGGKAVTAPALIAGVLLVAGLGLGSSRCC